MKKFLAVVLSLAIVAGLNITAFAATTSDPSLYIDTSSNDAGTDLIPGSSYTYDIRRSDNGRLVDSDFMKAYKYSIQILPKSGVVSASVKKNVDDYYEIVVRASSTVRDNAETASIRITTTKKSGNIEYTPTESDFSVDGTYEYCYDGIMSIDPSRPLVEFDRDVKEVELNFDDIALFQGKFAGSRKKNLAFNENENSAIVKKNYDAYIRFLNFSNKPSFTSGFLTFYTDDKYIYEITSSGLVKLSPTIKNGEARVRTDSLGSYAISDRALKDAEDMVEKPTTPTTPTKPTETTKEGAVNLAASVINSAPRSGSYAIVNLGANTLTTSGTDLINAGSTLKAGEHLLFRYTKSNAVQYQWYIDAKNASKASTILKLGMEANYAPTKAFFEKYFNNKVAVVRLNHSGAMGINTKIAVKTDLKGLTKTTLRAYQYNPTTNQYKSLPNAAPSIDSAGYLHLTLNEGGDIVITDKALASK